MRIHFVYAARPFRRRIDVAMGRLYLAAQRRGLPVRLVDSRTEPDLSRWGQGSPLSIPANLFPVLRSRAETLLYDWTEEVAIPGGGEQLLLGHPYPDDDRKVWNRSCRDDRFALRVAMFPLSHRMAEINAWFDPYFPHVDALIGIMGQYWYDTWDEGPLAHWKPKIVPLDMAVEAKRFPRVKRRFNPPGRRTFFYLGQTAAMKGTHLLSILFGMGKRHRCVVVGSGPPVRNAEFRPWAEMTPAYVRRLADECDIFLNLGVSDANPTTVLECMAWGFPVCCTPESGYHRIPEIVSMSTTDMRHNLAVLDELQESPEERLIAMADAARKLVETMYTWERFNAKVVDTLERLAAARGIRIWNE